VCTPGDFSAEGAESSACKNLAAAVLLQLTVIVAPRSEKSRDPGSSKSAFSNVTLTVRAT
jgi:hypothetical protein